MGARALLSRLKPRVLSRKPARGHRRDPEGRNGCPHANFNISTRNGLTNITLVMNAKTSGCVLSLVALAGFNACAPIDESYARSSRAAGRGPSAAAGRPAESQSWPQNRKTMAELESEELSIRNNASLSPAERQQQLQRVWKDQRDLIAGRAPSPTGLASQELTNQPAAPTPQPAPQTTAETSASQSPTPAADSPKPQPSPSAPPSKAEEPKYATKVPGKNGWIRSPYDGKVLDAAGVPPGTQVKDPDSGKIMIVP